MHAYICLYTNAYVCINTHIFQIWGKDARESEITHCLKPRYATGLHIYRVSTKSGYKYGFYWNLKILNGRHFVSKWPPFCFKMADEVENCTRLRLLYGLHTYRVSTKSVYKYGFYWNLKFSNGRHFETKWRMRLKIELG